MTEVRPDDLIRHGPEGGPLRGASRRAAERQHAGAQLHQVGLPRAGHRARSKMQADVGHDTIGAADPRAGLPGRPRVREHVGQRLAAAPVAAGGLAVGRIPGEPAARIEAAGGVRVHLGAADGRHVGRSGRIVDVGVQAPVPVAVVASEVSAGDKPGLTAGRGLCEGVLVRSDDVGAQHRQAKAPRVCHDLDRARTVREVLIEDAEGRLRLVAGEVDADVIVVRDARDERNIPVRLDRVVGPAVRNVRAARAAARARDARRGDRLRAAGSRDERVVAGRRASLSGQLIVDVRERDVPARRDRDLRARDALLARVEVERLLAVGDLVVARQDVVIATGRIAGIDLDHGAVLSTHHGQVFETADVHDLVGEKGREDRVAVVGEDVAAVLGIAVDLDLKRLLDERDLTFRSDHRGRRRGDVPEALRLEELARGREVLGERPESPLEFFGLDPLVVQRRVRVLLSGDQRLGPRVIAKVQHQDQGDRHVRLRGAEE